MALLSLPTITRDEWLFSVKTFASAMLAMFIANWAGLDRPFWALMTAYIIANSSAGAVRSKAVFRFLGTCIGSAAALFIIPHFSNAPALATLVMSCWVAGCLYISLLDRTPKSYVFMLAAYTAGFIGFPSVDKPELMFDNAIARVEEVGLAIACSAMIHSVFWPKSMSTVVLGLIDRSFGDIKQWFTHIVQKEVMQQEHVDRQRIASDMTQLRLLSTHIPYDTTHLRWTTDAVRLMQENVSLLTPHMSALEDRVKALLNPDGTMPEDVKVLLEEVAQWAQMQRGQDQAQQHAQYQQLMARLSALSLSAAQHPQTTTNWWHQALTIGFIQRLKESVQDWFTCIQLRQDMTAILNGAAIPLTRTRPVTKTTMHLDRGMAFLSALTTAITVSLCCAIWIMTEWSMGYAAAMMAAVACCFYASFDDPARPMYGFMKWTLWSVPVSAIYVMVLLPLVHDFVMLIVICAPFFLLVGCFIAKPAYFGQAMGFMFGVAMTLAMHDTRSADLVSYINFIVAEIIGLLLAAAVTQLIRSVQADWTAKRVQKAIWTELVQIANGTSVPQVADYAVRMLDRIAMIMPRIARSSDANKQKVSLDMMRDLRIGNDLVTLRMVNTMRYQMNFQPVFTLVARYYQQQIAQLDDEQLPSLLAKQLDTMIQSLLGELSDTAHADENTQDVMQRWVTALVGLRRNLCSADAAASVEMINKFSER